MVYDSTTHTNDAVRTRIVGTLQAGFTGLIRVDFANAMSMSIFALAGKAEQVYIRNHRLPSPDWERGLNARGDGTLTLKALPPNGIRFEKILLEHLNPSAFIPAKTDRLPAMFEAAKQNPCATLFHIRWREAEAFVIVAGGNLPTQKFLLLAGGSAEEGQAALKQILTWGESDCQVAAHRGDIKYQAWLEAHLNLLFEWSCGHIFQQYAKLTGFVMVSLIARGLKLSALQQGWTINVAGTDLSDSTIFATAADTGAAYREIISGIKRHAEPIIGGALTRSLLEQTRHLPRHTYKTIEEAFGLLGEVTP